MKIARFEKRILAYWIDMILPIVFSVGTIVVLAIFADIAWYFLALIGIGVQFFLYVIITSLSLYFSNGNSIGNKAAKIRTVSENKKALRFRDCFVRTICLGFWIYPIINAIFMLVLHTEKTGPDIMTKSTNVEKNN